MQAWLEVDVAEEADEEHDDEDALQQGVQHLQQAHTTRMENLRILKHKTSTTSGVVCVRIVHLSSKPWRAVWGRHTDCILMSRVLMRTWSKMWF